ncbi:hypothetical protein GCM10009795_015550 [Nocardioides hankookensis]|uniref:Uncharacterized protein n=1 Tax=Nocardioides hankookensis TaxID=443157 RepID=A0ABW1LJ48_9ACTN
MHVALRAALEPVLADIAATTDLLVRVEDGDWGSIPEQLTAMLWTGRSGRGVSVLVTDSLVERVVSVADQTEDWVPEEIGGTATNWPVCPEHPRSHPMAARAVDGEAWWICPVSSTTVARVGSLASG